MKLSSVVLKVDGFGFINGGILVNSLRGVNTTRVSVPLNFKYFWPHTLTVKVSIGISFNTDLQVHNAVTSYYALVEKFTCLRVNLRFHAVLHHVLLFRLPRVLIDYSSCLCTGKLLYPYLYKAFHPQTVVSQIDNCS